MCGIERPQPTKIIQDRIDGGDQKQGREGGRCEAECQARGQGDQDLGLQAFLQQQGGETGDGADGGEQNGPKAFPSRLLGRLGRRYAPYLGRADVRG